MTVTTSTAINTHDFFRKIPLFLNYFQKWGSPLDAGLVPVVKDRANG
jgi:hypothetical protein